MKITYLHHVSQVHYQWSRNGDNIDPLILIEDLKATYLVLQKNSEECSITMFGKAQCQIWFRALLDSNGPKHKVPQHSPCLWGGWVWDPELLTATRILLALISLPSSSNQSLYLCNLIKNISTIFNYPRNNNNTN